MLVMSTAVEMHLQKAPGCYKGMHTGVILKYLIARTAEQALVPTKHSDTDWPATSSNHAF